MEAKTRPFEPVNVGIINVETGIERFYHNDIYRAPHIAYWRVNLTALSQRHNLYFMATREKVRVYSPDFPYQNLGELPSLTIVPQLCNPTAAGYIDPERPHNINHLMVGDLGSQEILLLSTDSGNIVAYYTDSIFAAVQKDAYRFSENGNADFVGVRPMFSQWVDESAWGLAIHGEGRMIAVSANTPYHVDSNDASSKITVYAFALTTPGNVSDKDQSDLEGEAIDVDDKVEWKSWSTSEDETLPDTPTRDCNYKIILGGVYGHKNNVPCITFVNGPEDRTGSWLLSTDITGQMKMWQIWKGRCFRTWDFSGQSEAATPWMQYGEAGWLVAALDIHAFRPCQTMTEFIGHYRAPQYYGYHSSGDSYDLTSTVQRFTPQTSSLHPFVNHLEINDPDEAVEEDELILDLDTSDDDDDTPSNVVLENTATTFESASLNMDPTDPIETTSVSSGQLSEQPGDEMAIDVIDNGSSGQGSDSEDEDENGDEDIEVEALETDAVASIEIEANSDISDDEDEHEDESADVNGTERSQDSLRSTTSMSSYNAGDSSEHDESNREEEGDEDGDEPGLYADTTPINPSITAPASSHSSRMKQRSKHPTFQKQLKQDSELRIPQIPIIHCSTSHVRLFKGPTADYPHMFCARILRQTLPPRMEQSRLSALDRLCMMQQIPELGIVLIATQLGRCAICSITKRSRDGLLGFRVDWILPTKKQEQDGARPANHVLVGIATSPVQGHTVRQPAPLSEYDNDEKWATDRIVDGLPTTFDPEVVVLSVEPTPKTQVGDPTESSSFHLPAVTERRKWVKPALQDKWGPYENSRRYRLMLTYTDMTVLTYELSRGVERGDLPMEQTNGLDSLD